MKRLRTVVIIEERQGDIIDDNAGLDGGNWVELKRVYGEVTPGEGGVELVDGESSASIPYEIKIRNPQNLVSLFSADEGLNTASKRFKLLDGTVIYPTSVIDERMLKRRIIINGNAEPVAI